MSRQRRKESVEDLLDNNNIPSSTTTATKERNTSGHVGILIIKQLVVCFCTIYCLLLLLLYLSSTFRQQLVFLNYLKNPFLNYDDPEAFGLPNTTNFYINGKAGKLGVWYVPANGLAAINDGKPVILYMHGNAYSRATQHRTSTYKVLSALGCHVIAHDYRGFGDSDGIPTEQGLIDDSLTVFQWILANTNNGPVYLWGHSLGSAVAVAISKILTETDVSVMGVILEAPLNNMRDAAFNHPLATPYRMWPFFQDTLQEVNEMYKSDEIISSIKYNILILHDHGDKIVKFMSGKKLHEAALKHKKENQSIEFKEFTGFSHTTISASEDLPEILRNFMKLDK
ncbi:Hypothetical predicted protein [Paramuricea clavata]|uniref:Serine aminopeptidase S33 domain-containing protein n=1 Tax=Paramuricea clavata TaxID=317549 RepID=A0A7D9DXM3_PARCT|nr:Hypothetical predicted protein [Paramuricea clavata]